MEGSSSRNEKPYEVTRMMPHDPAGIAISAIAGGHPELLDELSSFDLNNDGTMDPSELLAILRSHRERENALRNRAKRLLRSLFGLAFVGAAICAVMFAVVFAANEAAKESKVEGVSPGAEADGSMALASKGRGGDDVLTSASTGKAIRVLGASSVVDVQPSEGVSARVMTSRAGIRVMETSVGDLTNSHRRKMRTLQNSSSNGLAEGFIPTFALDYQRAVSAYDSLMYNPQMFVVFPATLDGGKDGQTTVRQCIATSVSDDGDDDDLFSVLGHEREDPDRVVIVACSRSEQSCVGGVRASSVAALKMLSNPVVSQEAQEHCGQHTDEHSCIRSQFADMPVNHKEEWSRHCWWLASASAKPGEGACVANEWFCRHAHDNIEGATVTVNGRTLFRGEYAKMCRRLSINASARMVFSWAMATAAAVAIAVLL